MAQRESRPRYRSVHPARGRSRAARGVCALLLALLHLPAIAAEKPSTAQGIDESALDRAPVTLDGEALFKVKGSALLPAERRAALISERLRNVAANPAIAPDDVQVVNEADTTRLVAGDETLMVLSNLDAEAGTRERLAGMIVQDVRKRIQRYRDDRSRGALLEGVGRALIDTLVGGLLIFVLYRLRGKVVEWMRARFHWVGRDVKIQGLQLVGSSQMHVATRSFINLVWIVAVLLVVYLYLTRVLSLFPWTRATGSRLLELFLGPLVQMGRSLVDFLPDLIFLVILALLTRFVLRAMHLMAQGVEQGAIQFEDFDPEWAQPTYKIVRTLVIAFAVVVAYPYIPGSESQAFKGVSLFLGVIFSLGSSSVISNLIAGYTMTYRRAFRIGDRIQVGDVTGFVTEARLLVTRLRTPKNEEVVLPNSEILGRAIVNYSAHARTAGLIVHTTVGIGYETPWRQVHAMLLQAADRTPGLEKDPPPFVLQTALADFAVTYEINAYTRDPVALGPLYTALHQNILDVFNEHGVQIMTPAYEGDPEVPKVVPADQWYAAPATPPPEPAR